MSGLVSKLFGAVSWLGADGAKLTLGRALYAPLRALDIAPVNTSLLYALLFNAFMFGIACLMWRKKWFVKV